MIYNRVCEYKDCDKPLTLATEKYCRDNWGEYRSKVYCSFHQAVVILSKSETKFKKYEITKRKPYLTKEQISYLEDKYLTD